VTVSFINVLSVKYALKIQIIFTIAKLIALFIICIGGIVRLAQGKWAWSG
jgi:amino acid transporter